MVGTCGVGSKTEIPEEVCGRGKEEILMDNMQTKTGGSSILPLIHVAPLCSCRVTFSGSSSYSLNVALAQATSLSLGNLILSHGFTDHRGVNWSQFYIFHSTISTGLLQTSLPRWFASISNSTSPKFSLNFSSNIFFLSFIMSTTRNM